MQTESDTVTGSPPVHRVCYDNVHEWRQAACDVTGWNLDYYQIAPGPLKAVVEARNVGGIWVMRKQANLRVEVIGTPPDNHLTFIAPEAGQTVWANGFRIGEDDALLLQPDARAHVMCGPTSIFQAHVPFPVLRQAGMNETDIRNIDDRDGAIAVSLESETARPLRLLMSSAAFAVAGFADDDRSLALAACKTIQKALLQRRHPRFPRSEAWRTISRAREYIEANLHHPIRMNQVSDFAAASVSKIERTFRRELSVTPSQYILARRLHAVNRALESVDNDDTRISELAMQYGFRHLGRFSAAYRSHFGELPSQTLQAQLV